MNGQTNGPLTVAASVVRLTAPCQLEFAQETLSAAALRADQLLCETLVTAISPGTELAAYTGQPPLRDGPQYPRLQGYCNVARVLAVGSGVTALAVGDRILSFSSHRSHFVIDAADVLLRIPPGMPSGDAALTYLFHLGYNAVLRGGVRAGSWVLVLGLGALGLTSVAMARLAGAEVVAVSEHEAAATRARALGATQVFTRSQGDALAAALTPQRADVVIVTTNGWADWQLALRSAGMRATLAVLGFPGRGQGAPGFNPLEARDFYARQLRIEAVGLSAERNDSRGELRFNERDNLAWLLAQIGAGRLRADTLVSGRYAGQDIEAAYQALLARRGDPVTYLLEWNRE